MASNVRIETPFDIFGFFTDNAFLTGTEMFPPGCKQNPLNLRQTPPKADFVK
jgi:hypothetical protein